MLKWLDIGAASPRRMSLELDSVRDAGVSNRFPGFVTPALPDEYYGVPETTAGSAEVYGGLEYGTSASLVSDFDSVAKSLSLQDTVILASSGDEGVNGIGARVESQGYTCEEVVQHVAGGDCAVSTRVKLMTEIEESPCGVIDYGMVSHLTLDLKSMSLIPTKKASTEHTSQ